MNVSPDPLSAVLHDLPEELTDRLGYQPYADTLAQIILDANTQSPLTIGIFGGWGSGKTSLMKMIQTRLQESDRELRQQFLSSPEAVSQRLTHPIWFNAWLYSKEEALWRALIAQVIAGIRQMPLPPGYDDEYDRREKQRELDQMLADLYRVVGESALGSLSITGDKLTQPEGDRAAQLTLTLQQGLDLLETIAVAKTDGELTAAQALRNQVREATAELEQARVESLVRFQDQFRKLVQEFVLPYGYLVIFVDDLDRCLPEKAVEVLEAIKLFLDVPGCIFVLGIDRGVVERGIRLRYRELGGDGPDVIDGGRYLEKIIQIPFVLPPISRRAMGAFIEESVPNLPHRQCARVFAEHLERNPRQVKRAINIFTLLWRLSRSEARPELNSLIKPVRLAKMVVLQQRHEALYQMLREDPTLLIEWERSLREERRERERRRLQQLEQERFTAELSVSDSAAALATGDRAARQEQPGEAEVGILLPVAIRTYDKLEALRALLLMDHPSSGPDATPDVSFDAISPDEARAYVFLASAAGEAPSGQEGVRRTVTSYAKEQTPAEEEQVGDLDEARSILRVGAGLSESAIGSYSQRAYSAAGPLSEIEVRDGKSPDDLIGKVLNAFVPIGSAIYSEIASDEQRRKEMEERLGDETSMRILVESFAAQLPWEFVSNPAFGAGADEPLWEWAGRRLWGFQHQIERELGTYPDNVEISSQMLPDSERPLRILLGLDAKSRQYGEYERLLGALASDRGIEYEIVEELEDLRYLLVDGWGDINILHGQGNTDRSGLWISMGGQRLSLRLMRAWGGEGSGAMVKQVGVSEAGQSWQRPTGSALYIFDASGDLGRRTEWPSWLILLRAMGAGAVLAPMFAPHHSWSFPLIRRFLEEFLGGEALGLALLKARTALLADGRNPLGLYFALYGSALQRLPESVGEPVNNQDE